MIETNMDCNGVEITDEDQSDVLNDDMTKLHPGIDALTTLANNNGLSDRHRDYAASAIHMLKKYQEEAAYENEVSIEQVQPFLETTWTLIFATLRKRILETCDQEHTHGTNRQWKKNRFYTSPQSTICFSHEKDAEDLMQYGRIFISLDKPIHSILALYACANITKQIARGDPSINMIQKCSWLLTFAFEKLAEDKNIYKYVTNYLIPFLSYELTRFIRSVQTSCHKFRTESEAWCLMRMGICYGSFGDDANFAIMCENAVSLLRRKFKKGARFHQVHATCLSNAAVAYMKCSELEKADELITRCMEAYQNVKDWQGCEKEYSLSILKFNMAIKKLAIKDRMPQDVLLETDL